MSDDWNERTIRRRIPGEPELVPHFTITALSRALVVRHADGTFSEKPVPCPHKGKYKRGSRLVCMECYKSGMDHLGIMARDPATEPKPEPATEPAKPPKLTRKELRALRRDNHIVASRLTPQEREHLKQLGLNL